MLARSEIDIAVAGNPSERDFAEPAKRCNGNAWKYGGLTDIEHMHANMRRVVVPDDMLDGHILAYGEFLARRRVLKAQKIKTYFGCL